MNLKSVLTRHSFRYLALLVAGCIGLISILATGESTVNFKEAKVYPEFRCPADEVRAHWSTSPDTGIKVVYGGQERDAPGSGDYVVQAAEVNALPDPVAIDLKINASGGEVRHFSVNTIHGTEQVIRTGLRLDGSSSTYRYQIDLPQEAWGDSIFVQRMTLIVPKTFTCTGNPTVHNINWQFDKSTATSGYLLQSNGWKHDFGSSPVQAQGIWYLTLQNPGSEQFCAGWKITETQLSPQIAFDVACRN